MQVIYYKNVNKLINFDPPDDCEWNNLYIIIGTESGTKLKRILESTFMLVLSLAIYYIFAWLIKPDFNVTICDNRILNRIALGLIYFCIYIIMACMHEMLHIFVMPAKLSSHDIYFVVRFKFKIFPGFGVIYAGQISKIRFIFMHITPFIFLSALPLVFVMIFDINNPFIFMFIVLNATGSSQDIIRSAAWTIKIPRNSIIHLGKWKENSTS